MPEPLALRLCRTDFHPVEQCLVVIDPPAHFVDRYLGRSLDDFQFEEAKSELFNLGFATGAYLPGRGWVYGVTQANQHLTFRPRAGTTKCKTP